MTEQEFLALKKEKDEANFSALGFNPYCKVVFEDVDGTGGSASATCPFCGGHIQFDTPEEYGDLTECCIEDKEGESFNVSNCPKCLNGIDEGSEVERGKTGNRIFNNAVRSIVERIIDENLSLILVILTKNRFLDLNEDIKLRDISDPDNIVNFIIPLAHLLRLIYRNGVIEEALNIDEITLDDIMLKVVPNSDKSVCEKYKVGELVPIRSFLLNKDLDISLIKEEVSENEMKIIEDESNGEILYDNDDIEVENEVEESLDEKLSEMIESDFEKEIENDNDDIEVEEESEESIENYDDFIGIKENNERMSDEEIENVMENMKASENSSDIEIENDEEKDNVIDELDTFKTVNSLMNDLNPDTDCSDIEIETVEDNDNYEKPDDEIDNEYGITIESTDNDVGVENNETFDCDPDDIVIENDNDSSVSEEKSEVIEFDGLTITVGNNKSNNGFGDIFKNLFQ